MARYDGTIKIDTSVDQEGLVNGISKLKNIGGVAAKAVGGAFAATGAAMVAFGKQSIEAGMQFDSSMSQVAATMGTTVDQIGELRDFAQEMGATTAFSATQAADALNYMALAGYDAETSMSMLPNVLNLAAAGGMELASASDMITDSQSALGLTLSETSQLVDKMAKASSKSNTSVAQLGEAILTVGGTAKMMAGGTTELSAALGILADNGTKGAEGGTKLRNILLSLGAPTDKAAAELKGLGVDAYDAATGKMRPLVEIFGDLNNAMDGMTDAQKTRIISNIFNKADIKDVNALLATSADRWNELSFAIDGSWYSTKSLTSSMEDVGLSYSDMEKRLSELGVSAEDLAFSLDVSGGSANEFLGSLLEVTDASVSEDDLIKAMGGDLSVLQTAFDNTTGAAQAMADTQLDNLAGDVTLFQSALEGVQIAISDALTPALRDFVQFGSQGLSELTEALKSGDFGAVIDTFQGIITDGLNMLIEKLPGFISVGTDILLALVNGIIAALPQVTGAAVDIISTLAFGLADALPSLIPNAVDAIITAILSLTDPSNINLLIDGAISLIMGLADGLIAAMPVMIESAPIIIQNLVDALVENAPILLDAALELILALAEGLITNLPAILAAQWQIITAILQGCADLGASLWKWLTELGANIWNAVSSWFAGLDSDAEGFLIGIWETIASWFSGLASDIAGFFAGIWDSIVAFFTSLPGRLLEFRQTVREHIKEMLANLWENVTSFLTDLPEKIGFALGVVIGTLLKFGLEAFNWVVTAIPELISNIVSFFSELPGKIWDFLVESVVKIAEWGMQMREKASSSAREFLTNLVNGIKELPGKIWTFLVETVTKVTMWGMQMRQKASAAAREFLTNLVNGIKALPGKIWSFLVSTVSKIANFVLEMKAKATEAAKGFIANIVSGLTSLPGKMADIGTNVVKGIWNGIKDCTKWILDKIKGFGNSVLKGIKSVFGISSPSKVTKGYGKFFAEGFGIGFEKELPEVRRKLFGGLEDMSRKMRGMVNVENRLMAAGAYGGQGYSSVTNNTSTTYNPTLNFYREVETPSQAARAWRKAMEVIY